MNYRKYNDRLFGNRAKNARKELKLTQAEVARRALVSTTNVSLLERGQIPGWEILLAITRTLRIPDQEVVGLFVLQVIKPGAKAEKKK